ncbi:MAG: hypothetical protein LBR76_03530, partial [Oscillospiraceae bacterium]|nr:hypothetical protein [Oscillospiraceae bacterium]
DYLLGLIPDTNHAVSDVCKETKLSPEAARKLRIISRLAGTEYRSLEHLADTFDGMDEDFIEALNLAPFTVLPELLSLFLEHSEGLSILMLLSAIILGAETEDEQKETRIKLRSASKNFKIEIPLENITAALWVNIQTDAAKLKDELRNAGAQTE